MQRAPSSYLTRKSHANATNAREIVGGKGVELKSLLGGIQSCTLEMAMILTCQDENNLCCRLLWKNLVYKNQSPNAEGPKEYLLPLSAMRSWVPALQSVVWDCVLRLDKGDSQLI